jgi:ubiquinone/menaquinone biosynthesis C-methylase UbiE
MEGYYAEKLTAQRLQKCYEIAPPRTRQYLRAEMDFVLSRIKPGDIVLDLGCGYGRTLPQLAAKAGFVVGIDNSPSSLDLAECLSKDIANATVKEMDAANLRFADDVFDAVVCIQNGISAFQADQKTLFAEALRVCRPGGTVFFSTYAEKFWPHRLEWFRLQAAAGLLGEIEEEKTGAGVIVCRDGFTAGTISPEDFRRLAAGFPAAVTLTEVDGSSLFCILIKIKDASK